MEWSAILKTVGLCLISIIIEAVSYTKAGKQWFENLKQPKYSFSMHVWYFVGAVYYLLFGTIAYRLFTVSSSVFSVPIILLALVMVFNGMGNVVLFKYRSLKLFYFIIYPFSALLLCLIFIISTNDIVSTVLASLYFLWVIYDLYYCYYLWRLNESERNK